MSSHSQPGSDMTPTSWRAQTTSRLASFKDYVAQMDYKATYDSLSSRVRGTKDDGSKQTWDQWARQALRKPYGSSIDMPQVGLGVEKLQLFPGWAVRRYKDPLRVNERDTEFSLDVYVSGFASSVRAPGAATRSQKAFYRLAKGYAALPKLSTPPGSSPQRGPVSSPKFDQPSDFALTTHPPRPTGYTEQTELETLEAHFKKTSGPSSSASSSNGSNDDDDVSHPNEEVLLGFLSNDEVPKQYTNPRSDPYRASHHIEPIPLRSEPPTLISSVTQTALPPTVPPPEQTLDYTIQRLHTNLDSRLQLFWSSAIPNRMIRLSIFCPSGHASSETQDQMEGQGNDFKPLATKYVSTSPQGAFQTMVSVPWDQLATHPPSLHIAFGERDIEYPVVVQAEMCTPPPNPPSPSPAYSVPCSPNQHNDASRFRPHPLSESLGALPSVSSPQLVPPDPGPAITDRITVSLSIQHVPVRLISDIDDTIKHAGVLQGAKHVFQNVFVRHLEELVIPSMVDWYRALWQKGVRFHYVSNSPFELLPVLTEYIRVSSLPEGSIRLKSYAARSLLPALLSSPAARKRQGVVEVLDAFPESRFMLVGDTGEQDMELYAELARERPHQVVGVFVRNVTTGPGHDVASMPSSAGQVSGNSVLNAHFGGPLVDTEPESIKSMPSMDSLSSSSSWTTSGPNFGTVPRHSYSAHSPTTPTASMARPPRMFPRSNSWSALTVDERRQYELETRIKRAQAEIPKHIAFRVFREPDECVEVHSILNRFLGINSESWS